MAGCRGVTMLIICGSSGEPHATSSAMNPTLYLVRTPCLGGTDGKFFDDPIPVGDLSTAAINRIVVRHGEFIDCLEVYYSWNNGAGITHGGSGGTRNELTFEPDEFITRIEGNATDDNIVGLTFVTSKRRWGPYGSTHGKRFTWGDVGVDGIPSRFVPRMRLLAINGKAGPFLFMLQATFAEYREHTSKTVRYESVSVPAPGAPTQTGSSATLSKFASHLMAPIITLFVGQEKVEFHAYEDTLCQLPFFKAALQGQFKEALQKTIDMPEDDPSKVSALIEYLYTGSYTYTFNPIEVQIPNASQVPIGDLAEGLFHVGVYVVATKYTCPGLVEIAIRCFKAVLNELDNIDTLRLWKTAYAEGIQFPDRRIDFNQYSPSEGMVFWVRGLFEEYHDEMEMTMAEYPGLACDLLRVATGHD